MSSPTTRGGGRRRATGGRGLIVRAHAKVNLSLRALDVRPDGYHGLETVFQSLALHDTITIAPHDGPLVLSCSDPSLPVDGRNLVTRAAARLWTAAGRKGEPAGARIHVRKRIPQQGGLGGGSSDAAAALVALDAFWGTGLPAGAHAALGRELGADVPFFLCGGTALGLDRGDEIYALEEPRPAAMVLVFPPFGVPTPEAFRWLDEDRARGPAAPSTARPSPREPRGVPYGRLPLTLRVFNDLEAPVSRRHGAIATIRRTLERAGAVAAAMTGSGSTVFGLFSSSTLARAAAARLERRGRWRVVVTRTALRAEAQPSSILVWKRFSRID